MATTAHRRPQHCFVCGAAPHPDTDHTFWSNAEAFAEAQEADRQTTHHYPGGATSAAAAYVAEHRPY